jgi:prophage tail gpP-like protein
MAKTHIVSLGELLKRDISRRFYGTPENYKLIISANPFLSSRTLTEEGTPQLQVGDKLTIPGIAKKTDSVVKAPDELEVFIEGSAIKVPSNFTFNETFDTCTQSFSLKVPFDPIADRGLYIPFSNQEISIFIGGTQRLSGVIESITPSENTGERSITLSGRSRTYILQKTAMPTSAYPLERNNITLENILRQWILPIFSLELLVENATTAPFSKVSAKEQDSVWKFISELAKQKARLLSGNGAGQLVLKEYKKTGSVYTFEEGVSLFKTPSISYESAKVYRTTTGYSQSPGAPNNKATEILPFINENSFKIFEAKESTPANIAQATKWESTKDLRNAFKFPIEVPGWLIPNGGRAWEAGDVVTIKAPSSLIYKPVELLLRRMEFSLQGNRKSTNIELILPNTYSSNPKVPVFWE